ncbi:hypothetical protein QTP86_000492 [Hemibagrus guttatus]|nr:hypothetical protein QTP86_000492 [Hemibagrus guttatus]
MRKKNSLLLQKFQKDLNAGVFNTQENELLKQIIRQDREMVMMVERKQSVTGANSTPMSGNSIINSPAQPPFANSQFQQQPQSSPLAPMPPMTYSTSASIIPAARLAGSVAFSSPGNPATPLQQQPTPGGIMSPCSFTAGRTFQYGSPTASQLSLVPQLSAVTTQQQQSSQPQQASPQRNEVHSSLSRDVRHLSASQPSLPHETSLTIRQHPSSGESLASIQPAVSPSPQAPGSAPQQGAIRATVPPRVSLFRQMSSGALPPVRAAPSTVQHRDPMGSRRESAVLNSGTETEQDKLRFATLNFIPDRSRPGLTTTAIGAVDLQGAGGNWATVGGRSRGGRRVRRQREKRKGKSVGLRIGTLNVGTMTGKGRELADMMERRKVDILCVQETRWKGSKARSIGAGFKLFYYGVDSKRNGVGVVLKEEFVRNVLEVKRVSDRVMSLKLEIEGVMLNVVSGYAPQVGCELEEKERFWSELDEVMESIPTGERVVIGADFNGHVGEGNTGDEEVMGKFGVKEKNLEGQMVVDFAKRMDMAVVNIYFQKREEHRVTYKSGGRSTQVDYILCRRGNLKEISDCKVVVGESVARQHRMVLCRMTLMVCKKKRSEIEKKTKWWKQKKEECCEEFRQKLRQALGGQVVLPDDWETTAEVIRETGRKVLGVSSGRRKEDKETWWWNEEVQDSIQRKRLAKKKWDMDRTEENRQEYKELQRSVKREVSKAKQKAYDELYTRLDTREGEKDLYRLARQRDRDGKDVQQVRVIKDRDGRVLTSEESVQRRWKKYFEELMNEENEREKRVEGVNSVEQKVDKIRKDEVRKALKRMKSGKAVGPDDIPVEVWKCLGEAAVEFLASLFNRVLESERMPEEWRRSVLVPIFKNKGDVQSCSNYRGIKLMSHTMKLWERVVEARLRKVVEICEQQYGFMPRKSTTDAIFALRILMEKYRDGQRELHCVFVDLEKAYDRVPREELWYCMRKSGVAEKYVRVVQDMYERSRTVVRCAVGQTEEFKVEVGLHQGSALSPFLFAIVMDQLSEEVRQESPWTMMFADDIVICSESREQVEENLERWRFALERRGMKVSRSKTEYMCVNEREGSGTVRLQGEEVKKVQEFKYLGSTVQSNGECGKEVKKRVQAGWNGWRKVWGVLCERKISARIKGKVYRTVVRAAMLYGLETVSLRKRQESELEVAELKMLSSCKQSFPRCTSVAQMLDELCPGIESRPTGSLRHLKEGRKEGRKEGEKGMKRRKDRKNEGRKGRKDGRKEGGKEKTEDEPHGTAAALLLMFTRSRSSSITQGQFLVLKELHK